MKKMKFSLKFKILLGISFLLIVITAFNLSYSYKLFIDDKTGYIFETGLKKAENISDQINFKINDLIEATQINSELLNNPSVDFEKFMSKQTEIIITGSIKSDDGKLIIDKQYFNTKAINHLSNAYKITAADLTSEILQNGRNPKMLSANRTWLFSPNPKLKFLMYVSDMSSDGNYYFSISDISLLLEMFYKDRTYTNKLIFLANAKERLANSAWIEGANYKESKKKVYKAEIEEQEYLVAQVFVNEKLIVLSAIKQADAFRVTKFLILKTTLFGTTMLGVALIMGIYFSSSITRPIVTLTNIAKRVAKGDFLSRVHINTSDEIKILGDTFNFMNSEIQILIKGKEELIEKLEDYSKNLELMVEQRTLELKESNDFMALMVNSLDQGLLVFDSDLKCHPMFTKACLPIFGTSPLDKTIPEVLDIKDEGSIDTLKQWATVVFNEVIPFESAVNLGPKEKITGKDYHDPDYKNVQIEYYPMRGEDEKISNIVLIATDKTNEVQATEKAKENEAYVSMILKILNNKTQFESFIKEVEEIFSQFKATYSIEEEKIEFDLCMMLFHTLNGGFGIYSISSLQVMARGYEEEISQLKSNRQDNLQEVVAEYIPTLVKNVDNLKQAFLDFRLELDSLIGTKFAINQSFSEVPREKILELRDLIAHTKNKILQSYYNENFVKVPIINYFKAYDDLCKTTAVKINKQFNGLIFNNADLKIEAEPLTEFFNVLVHLFRNCLDHGLESAYTREANGKTPEGHITVSFDMMVDVTHKKFLSVVIEDDGGGIDPNIIRARYQKLRPEEDISSISDKDIIYKIFDPFFSTRDEVSALSGRGVGMSAIKEVVDRLQGQIEIESQVGKGTTFSFLIPTGELF